MVIDQQEAGYYLTTRSKEVAIPHQGEAETGGGHLEAESSLIIVMGTSVVI